ncbi:MAG: hypothetical protein JW715_08745 [Sedimentisphaerales bacterium]|nr:hypothetical protein [Sedimentisphaerales bacterium]
MKQNPSIITIGLSPAWDITCRGQNLNWGRHKNIDEQTIIPAGKALNISKALAWLGQKNIAAGLWGNEDYRQMQKTVKSLWPLIKVKMTAVSGRTRCNVTVVDAAEKKEMHLRSKSELAAPQALRQLKADLQPLVRKNSICVFAGAMPEGKLLGDVLKIVDFCRKAGAKIVLDTSGPALRKIVETGKIWIIKPNVRELSEPAGRQIKDNPADLSHAGAKLLDKVEIVLISRGENGAVVVTKEGIWQGKCAARVKVISTVGCGDYLLAGFLKGLVESENAAFALETAIKIATAKAGGRVENERLPDISKLYETNIHRIK